MNVDFYSPYAPQAAENGKFAPIDLSTLSPEYSGSGRFAVLTYSVGGTSTISLSSATIVQTKPNTTKRYSQTIAAYSSSVVTIAPAAEVVEIFNNSANSVYLSFIASDTYSDVINYGLVISAATFYSIDRQTSTLTLATSAATSSDVRIITHYVV
jgi:hypothetical protein